MSPCSPARPLTSQAKREFTGLANPPALVPDTALGGTFNLTAARLGPVSLGTPVFFHDLDVGKRRRLGLRRDGRQA